MRIPILKSKLHYRQMFSRASVPNQMANGDKNKGRRLLSLRPKKKNGARDVACPGCGFSRLEPEADSQAEMPLVELGARDLQEVPAVGASVVNRTDHNAAIAIGVVEMW